MSTDDFHSIAPNDLKGQPHLSYNIVHNPDGTSHATVIQMNREPGGVREGHIKHHFYNENIAALLRIVTAQNPFHDDSKWDAVSQQYNTWTFEHQPSRQFAKKDYVERKVKELIKKYSSEKEKGDDDEGEKEKHDGDDGVTEDSEMGELKKSLLHIYSLSLSTKKRRRYVDDSMRRNSSQRPSVSSEMQRSSISHEIQRSSKSNEMQNPGSPVTIPSQMGYKYMPNSTFFEQQPQQRTSTADPNSRILTMSPTTPNMSRDAFASTMPSSGFENSPFQKPQHHSPSQKRRHPEQTKEQNIQQSIQQHHQQQQRLLASRSKPVQATQSTQAIFGTANPYEAVLAAQPPSTSPSKFQELLLEMNREYRKSLQDSYQVLCASLTESQRNANQALMQMMQVSPADSFQSPEDYYDPSGRNGK